MERHGFTTFWLVLILILNVIGGSIYIFSPQIIFYQYPKATSGILFLLSILNILAIVAAILLLCWKKFGFWLFLGIMIVNVPLCISVGMSLIQSIWGLISIASLWGILHIRKNGISTWDYLSNNYTYEETYTNKKCRQCNTVYTSSRSTCPNCGSSLYEETNQKQVSEYKPISTPITGDTWVCKNCNEVNRSTSSSCKGCGEYR
jgi:RNA polymerase subunit RPABC4/transcription elongation factor Spt4